jgi:hypothetical protein
MRLCANENIAEDCVLRLRQSGHDFSSNLVTTGITNFATIRVKARWLAGNNKLWVRLHGNWLDAFAVLPTPTNLGTPGAGNSRAVTNAGPAIWDVQHYPVEPQANEVVLISARVYDPDSPTSVSLNYRIDPSNTYTSVSMLDNGTGGDAVAGDGLYSASVSNQPSGTLVAFYLQAVDNAGVTNRFPKEAPVRECLVRFGEIQPPASFGTYRFWLTQTNTSRWATREKQNDEPLDATFVYGKDRVIYNIGLHPTQRRFDEC